MVLVAVVLILIERFVTDINGMHMSIGFTVPFTMIMKDPAWTAKEVGLIVSGFNNHSVHCTSDEEVRGTTATNSQQQQFRPLTQADLGFPESEEPAGKLWHCWAGIWRLVAKNPVPVLSLAGIAIIGFPTARATGNDAALDTFFLFSLWTGTLAAQSTVKNTTHLHRHPRWRIVLATLLNAVLWTSLGTIAYTTAKTAAKHVTIVQALNSFHTGTTLADLIYAGSHSDATMGAGDIATSVLDAGIVIWGLKLFECRAQLFSRAGLTALMVGSVFAVISVVGGPLLVHAMGLIPASRALAFAARSVTIALAGPAMTSLGGDSGLNAAMVVINGIVFQVAMGLGACQWTVRMVSHIARRLSLVSRSGSRSCCESREINENSESSSYILPGLTVQTDSAPMPVLARWVSNSDQNVTLEAERAVVAYAVEMKAGLAKGSGGECMVSMRGGEDISDNETASSDSPGTVAVGMMVGVNAAAMGTAYLYEEASRAAPYAALSMTVFGVMVVVFTAIRPLAAWLASQVT
ncbi:hypothetical protein CMQ_7425 [Grosmannia clavigera kw1407]|uniref:LrgB-like protein n=1 Tax=Grosmannia clavigera (strain kw1407 / UAMH 11150) TaxID=655863 RepID=F0XNX5_GROCL|nr:uncharacterized protein CMQ_7425 [Grosmannia clavigera kw1407]EFX00423.1 hypothetical protein CMQ_7425 [Grosmannia clavigera kw1407]